MKNKKKITKLMGLLTVISVVGFAALAVAGQSATGTYNQGMQGRQMRSGGQSWGGHRGSNWNDWSCSDQGNMGNMSAEDMQRMQQECEAFLKDTNGLRQDLYQKDLELRNELSRQNPDNRKVANLENEISRLKSQLYQKEQAYMAKMRKINPNMGRGYMKGGGRGMMGHGGGQGMMGPGGANR